MLYNVQMHYLSLVLWVLVSAKKSSQNKFGRFKK